MMNAEGHITWEKCCIVEEYYNYEDIFYALREYDEQKYVEKFSKQYAFEYGFTSDYPSMENVQLAKGDICSK